MLLIDYLVRSMVWFLFVSVSSLALNFQRFQAQAHRRPCKHMHKVRVDSVLVPCLNCVCDLVALWRGDVPATLSYSPYLECHQAQVTSSQAIQRCASGKN